MKRNLPNPTITFMIEYGGKFLLIKRNKEESNYPNLWAFPGGKVEIGETVIDTIVREVKEETGLSLDGKVTFLNTYSFGSSVGLAFMVHSESDKVENTGEFQSYQWVASLEEMKQYACIEGIYNHLVNALNSLKRGDGTTFDEANLTKEKYLN